MLDMAEKDVLPAVTTYEKELAKTVNSMKEAGFAGMPQKNLLRTLNSLYSDAVKAVEKLKAAMAEGKDASDWMSYGRMELHTAKKYWPFPTYGDLLFSVN